jgi:hypothetical protein
MKRRRRQAAGAISDYDSTSTRSETWKVSSADDVVPSIWILKASVASARLNV